MAVEAKGTDARVRRAAEGDGEALGALLEEQRERLLRMVRVRLDRRLQARVDPSDVVQEVFLEASRRFAEFARGEDFPLFLWLRLLTEQRIAGMHRFHLGAQARDPRREAMVRRRALIESTSAALAGRLVASGTSPSRGAARGELAAAVRKALAALEEDDREVLALRHFEQLTNLEAARALGIEPPAASKRYVRALRRLREGLEALGLSLDGADR